MLKPLTERQIKIIQAVVQEYTQTAQPVGSETIDKKYNLGVSPATIRNEMARLEDLGYLIQPHTSAGRIPTPQAIKLYVTELMKLETLPVVEEVEIKERLWDLRDRLDQILKESARLLSEKTQVVGLALSEEGEIYSSGYAQLLDLPEFFDIDVTKTVLSLVESPEEILDIFKRVQSQQAIRFLLGDDLQQEPLKQCALVFTDFNIGPRRGYLGVLGSLRLNYSRTVPLMEHLHDLLEEIEATQ